MWYYFIFSSKFGCRLTDIAECLNKLHLKIFTPGCVILVLKFREWCVDWLFCSSSFLFPLEISGTCDTCFLPHFHCSAVCSGRTSCSPLVLTTRPAPTQNSATRGPFAPGGCGGCCWASNRTQTFFIPTLTGWEDQFHHPFMLYLSFVFLRVDQKLRFTKCFSEHCRAFTNGWVGWGWGKLWELLSWSLTPVGQWFGTFSSMSVLLWNWVFLNKMLGF